MIHDGKPWSTDCLHIMSELRSSQKMCWIFVSRSKEVKWEIQLF